MTNCCNSCKRNETAKRRKLDANGVCNECSSGTSRDNDTVTEEFINEELLNTTVSQLTVRDIIKIISETNRPLIKKLDDFKNDLQSNLSKLEKRVELLENENTRIKDENESFRSVLISMQKCLNKIDSEERKLNLMISGVAENNININNQTLSSDDDKITY